MGAFQRETRIPVVVEATGFPVLWRMAPSTISKSHRHPTLNGVSGKLPCMDVFMTIHTLDGKFFKAQLFLVTGLDIRPVAVGARDSFVLALQRELRIVGMIEIDLVPGFGGVATLATAHLNPFFNAALVRIGMAGLTGQGLKANADERLPVCAAHFFVALIAGDRTMSPF